ncbi:MAG: hypothetical protein IT393_00905 [Nitrospirae bacterium]|nr:hypothetical protein [Nitrospirota bacterium]
MSREMLDKILNAVVDLKINMETKFEHMEVRFRGVDRRLDMVGERLTSVETRLGSVERRLDRVEGELGHIRTAVLKTGRTVKGHEERIVAMEGRG